MRKRIKGKRKQKPLYRLGWCTDHLSLGLVRPLPEMISSLYSISPLGTYCAEARLYEKVNSKNGCNKYIMHCEMKAGVYFNCCATARSSLCCKLKKPMLSVLVSWCACIQRSCHSSMSVGMSPSMTCPSHPCTFRPKPILFITWSNQSNTSSAPLHLITFHSVINPEPH